MRQRRISEGLRMARLGLGATQNLGVAALVTTTAAQNDVDPSLALAVAQQESGLNPDATSPAGAQGVMQLMPATQQDYGVTDPYDPVQNITAGVQYLGDLLDEFGGDVAAALAAYNWGPGNVTNAMNTQGSNWLASAPTETQNYVANIAGITAADVSAGAPTTIDASTGEVVQDDTDVDALESVNGIGGGVDFGALALAAGVGLGIWLLADNL